MSKFFRQMNSLRERDDKERKSRLELVKGSVTPTVVVTPTQPLPSTEQQEIQPTVGETQLGTSSFSIVLPTVGATPSVAESVRAETPLEVSVLTYTKLAAITPSEDVSPTVGATLQKVSYSKGLAPLQIGSQWISLSSGKCYPASRVLRVDIAQTSLGLGELHIYKILWSTVGDKYLRVLSEQKECRRASIGYDALARLANFNEKSIRDLIPKLKEKLVLSEVAAANSYTRQGKTYDVFSYQQILERQRAAGLCYVIKNGKAVEFVQPAQNSEGVSPTVGATPSVVESPTETVGVTSTRTVGVTPTPLENKIKRKESKPTSAYNSVAPPGLYKQFCKLFDDVDEAAVNRIWSEGREVVPDISPDDVLRLFQQRARYFSRIKRVEHPLGLLLSTIKIWIKMPLQANV